jgi:hypothetical protein
LNWRRGLRRLAVVGWGCGMTLIGVTAGYVFDLHRPFANVCAEERAAAFPECIVKTRPELPDDAGFARRLQRNLLDLAAPEPVDPTRVVPHWRTEAYQRALRRTAIAAGLWSGLLVAALWLMDWVARGFERSS